LTAGRTGFPGLNELQTKYGEKGFAVIGVQCNQFGLQNNEAEKESLNILKYVRPGDGYEPNFDLYGAVRANGEGAEPLYTWLKEALPEPKESGIDIPGGRYLTDTKPVTLAGEVCGKTDVKWNFEKFLIGKDGQPLARFQPRHDLDDIAAEIEKAL
jgi:glutathione peroxidase